MWDGAKKYFASGSKRHPEVGMAAKDLSLADVNLGEFCPASTHCGLTSGQAMMTAFMATAAAQTMPAKALRSRSRKEAAGALNIYLFVVIDAQLNIEDGRFVSAAN